MAIKKKVEEEIADRIIELLDRGELPPWSKGWRNSKLSAPQNATTGRDYSGINRWLLLIAQQLMGYGDPRWLTFKQALGAGGSVRKGEKGTSITLYKQWEPKGDRKGRQQPQEAQEGHGRPRDGAVDPEAKTRTIPLIRFYTVFNLEQTDGCEKITTLADLLGEELGETREPIERAQEILLGMPDAPPVNTYLTGNQAPHYNQQRDVINIPDMTRFEQVEEWYSTLFHEMVHSTGHERRLGRFAHEEPYSDIHGRAKEELLAEMGAAILSAEAGVETQVLENSAAYIRHWRDTIRADKPIVVRAASMAQKATSFILKRDDRAERPEMETQGTTEEETAQVA